MVIVGATGSGKTQFLAAQVERYPFSPIYLLDTKGDEKLGALAERYPSRTIDSLTDFRKVIKERKPEWDIVRILPKPEELQDEDILDAYLDTIYHRGQSCLTCIDETYMLGATTRPRPGALGLLTRGRSKGMSLIACTQRPAWIPRFYFSESQKFAIFYLQDIRDRQRVSEMIPYPRDLTLDKHHFFYYVSGQKHGTIYAPIQVPKHLRAGYVDEQDTRSRLWI